MFVYMYIKVLLFTTVAFILLGIIACIVGSKRMIKKGFENDHLYLSAISRLKSWRILSITWMVVNYYLTTLPFLCTVSILYNGSFTELNNSTSNEETIIKD